VLHVRRVDRDTALTLLGRVVDLVVRLELNLRVRRREHLRDRRRQRRLPVVHVTDRPDVHVRLATVELLLGHCCPYLETCSPDRLEPTIRIELMTSSLP